MKRLAVVAGSFALLACGAKGGSNVAEGGGSPAPSSGVDDRSEAPALVETLASGLGAAPTSIVVDATHVYLTTADGKVLRVPIAGGPLVEIATAQAKPGGLALNKDYVFWANAGDGTVMKLVKGGAFGVVAMQQPGAHQVLANEIGLLWATADSIWSEAVGGGPAKALASGKLGLQRIVMGYRSSDPQTCYAALANGGEVRCVPLSQRTGAPFGAAALGTPVDVALDASGVYWLNERDTDSDTGSVSFTERDGTPRKLITGLVSPASMAIDEARVYWLGGVDGSISSAPLKGGAPAMLVTGGAKVFVVDEANVYWAGGGLVAKRAKPR